MTIHTLPHIKNVFGSCPCVQVTLVIIGVQIELTKKEKKNKKKTFGRRPNGIKSQD